jgi:uncharacterized membrane protein YeaQ/YmgE (transglycosylase-associated protein family)
MSSKTIYYIAAFVGSIIGGWIPTLWGTGLLSVTDLVFSTIGAVLAIILIYKLSN